jgi:hypothetical protein
MSIPTWSRFREIGNRRRGPWGGCSAERRAVERPARHWVTTRRLRPPSCRKVTWLLAERPAVASMPRCPSRLRQASRWHPNPRRSPCHNPRTRERPRRAVRLAPLEPLSSLVRPLRPAPGRPGPLHRRRPRASRPRRNAVGYFGVANKPRTRLERQRWPILPPMRGKPHRPQVRRRREAPSLPRPFRAERANGEPHSWGLVPTSS